MIKFPKLILSALEGGADRAEHPPFLRSGKKGSESGESVFSTQAATHDEFTPTAGKYFSHLEKLTLCDATEGSVKEV